jgi:hypothetical protein
VQQLKPPDLWPPVGLSEKEYDATQYLGAVVFSLRYFVEGFAAALELYKFSRSWPVNISTQTILKWRWFALDAGAMEIWHLRESLNLVPRKIGPCATVAKYVDRDAMQRGIDLFDEQHFPDFRKIRDGIAHAPTISLSRDGGYMLDDGSIASGRITDEHRYEVINKGKRYHFDMTDETLRKVAEVVTTYWAAFAPVEKAFDQAGRSD